LVLQQKFEQLIPFQKVIFGRERQMLLQFAKASNGGVPVVVVLAVSSWDEDVGSSYNTHG